MSQILPNSLKIHNLKYHSGISILTQILKKNLCGRIYRTHVCRSSIQNVISVSIFQHLPALVFRDAERNGEVQNGFTSCFAGQTGSVSIFLPVID